MPVITVAGPPGAGAREVGREAAALLGIDYVDREILADAARRLGVSVAAMARRDERAATFGERLSALLRGFLERSAVAGLGDPFLGPAGLEVLLGRTYADWAPGREEQPLDDARYFQVITAVIQELGRRGDIVIIGRGGQVILKELRGALHVMVWASPRHCIENLARREGLSLEEAGRLFQEGEKGRLAFHRKFFRVDANDPRLYDLALNTDRLSFTAAARVVAQAALAKAG